MFILVVLALKLLNMTEEEVNKEYDKKDITELGVEITNKFNNYCNNVHFLYFESSKKKKYEN